MTESTPPTGRVLAIDDEPEILETYEAILGKQGIRLTKAETLDAGVRLAATRPFDVCLLDRNVGYELANGPSRKPLPGVTALPIRTSSADTGPSTRRSHTATGAATSA